MVPAAGVEPATFRSGGERSNPLSYAGLIIGFKEVKEMYPSFYPSSITEGAITLLLNRLFRGQAFLPGLARK